MTWKLFSSDAPVIIQGMTGKEGTRMAAWLIASGTNVVAGVTPGKGGQTVQDRPIFNCVADACEVFPGIEATCVVVPPAHVKSAAKESMDSGIRLVNVLSEGVPVHDAHYLINYARAKGAILLGPSSVGYLQFPQFRLGYLGGERPFNNLREGDIGLASTSGGMTNELMTGLAREGFGIRLAVALGGDPLVGWTLEDALACFESETTVQKIVLFVEPGRSLLRGLAQGRCSIKKPAVIFLAGEALDQLPKGMPYGHTGTILGEGDQSVIELRDALRSQGVACVGTMSDLIKECKKI